MNSTTANLHLPRLLCLHGGGSNSDIFRMQMRAFLISLRPHFRLVFADGPFLCPAGPGIVPVYEDFGPFHSWLNLQTGHVVDHESVVSEVHDTVRRAMEVDPGYGDWVGVVGFSQGAKLAGSLLLEQQLQGVGAKTGFRFGVLMAARAPLVSLSALSGCSESVNGVPITGIATFVPASTKELIRIPTVHIHGLKDVGLELHRELLNCCEPDSVTTIEWEGDHRVAYMRKDIEIQTEAILGAAKKGSVW